MPRFSLIAHPLTIPLVVASVALFTALEAASGERGLASSITSPAGSRPNIILILADDLGYSDLGCFGGEIQTPNLDRLGMGGTRFTQFYNNAKCAPTRASLMTGLYSQQTGCHGPPVQLSRCVTLAEVLRSSGYRTWMTGKWHAAETPHQRGFERHFGPCHGHLNYWNPGERRPGEPAPAAYRPDDVCRWAIDDREYLPWTPEDRDFYATDAFTDHAIRYIREGREDPRPFFLHIAYTAPHFPLQARPADIEKYRGRYRKGWDTTRLERYHRQLQLGLIDAAWGLPPRDETVPAWLEIEDKDQWDLRMSVYAAMVDRMDQNIGRLLEALRAAGKDANTLILFLSDNGGTAEDYNRTPDVAPGPIDSYRTLDAGWANVTNTPFRKFKMWNHEGGISTPFIAHWPGVVPAGAISDEVGHVIDIMPTVLELAGAEYPKKRDGASVLPFEGRSLLPLLVGGERPSIPLMWQFGGAAAVRIGNLKAVRRDRKSGWELYNIEADRTEMNDLAQDHPAELRELVSAYDDWVQRVGARP
jgi:arylsulfatase